jgi:hypothetical protein
VMLVDDVARDREEIGFGTAYVFVIRDAQETHENLLGEVGDVGAVAVGSSGARVWEFR